jgi:hypothetical protein
MGGTSISIFMVELDGCQTGFGLVVYGGKDMGTDSALRIEDSIFA